MVAETDRLFSVSLSLENLTCAFHAVRRELVAMIVREPDGSSPRLEQYLSTLENLHFARARAISGDSQTNVQTCRGVGG